MGPYWWQSWACHMAQGCAFRQLEVFVCPQQYSEGHPVMSVPHRSEHPMRALRRESCCRRLRIQQGPPLEGYWAAFRCLLPSWNADTSKSEFQILLIPPKTAARSSFLTLWGLGSLSHCPALGDELSEASCRERQHQRPTESSPCFIVWLTGPFFYNLSSEDYNLLSKDAHVLECVIVFVRSHPYHTRTHSKFTPNHSCCDVSQRHVFLKALHLCVEAL